MSCQDGKQLYIMLSLVCEISCIKYYNSYRKSKQCNDNQWTMKT